MAKVQAIDDGKVIDSQVQEFKWGSKTWIKFRSTKDDKKKVIVFDGLAHCRSGAHIWVYYSDAEAVVVISEEVEEFREAVRLFGDEYRIRFEDFEQMLPEQLTRLKEENPAAVKDGEFLRDLKGLPKINASKIWDEDEKVIWHKC